MGHGRLEVQSLYMDKKTKNHLPIKKKEFHSNLILVNTFG